MAKRKRTLIVAINGSPRKNGDTADLLKKVLKSVEKRGGETAMVHLGEKDIKPCRGCYSSGERCKYPCNINDDMRELHELLLKADGIVLGTPTYWFAPSGLMKTFIDRLTCLEESGFLLEGKVCGFVSSAEESGGEEALLPLAAAMNQMGLVTLPYSLIFHCPTQKSGWAVKDCDLLGKNMMQMCGMLKERKPDWGYEK